MKCDRRLTHWFLFETSLHFSSSCSVSVGISAKISRYSKTPGMMKNNSRKGPLLFSEFGKNARDLLTNGFCGKKKLFRVSTTTPSGLVLTSTAARGGQYISADVKAQFNYEGDDIDVQFISLSQQDFGKLALANFTVTGEILPSIMAKTSFALFPHSTSGRRRFTDYFSTSMNFLFSHRHASLGFAVANRFPTIGLIAASVGSPSISFGIEGMAEPAFNCSFYSILFGIQFTLLSAGFQLTKPTWDASILVANNGDVIRVSYFHHMDKEKKISAGIEMTRSLPTRETLLITGGSWAINHLTVAKARLDSLGTLKILLQHSIHAKACLTLSAEIDTNNLTTKPAIGLAVVLNL